MENPRQMSKYQGGPSNVYVKGLADKPCALTLGEYPTVYGGRVVRTPFGSDTVPDVLPHS